MREKITKAFKAMVTYFKGVDNLYQKFILTLIALIMVWATIKVSNELRNIADCMPETFDGYVTGSIDVE